MNSCTGEIVWFEKNISHKSFIAFLNRSRWKQSVFCIQAGLGSQILLRGSVKCRLQTIVFRVRKQWDFCCLVPICIVETIVRSLSFSLTDITALFTNMRILKFKSQLMITFFAAVNHLNGPLRKQNFTLTGSKGRSL